VCIKSINLVFRCAITGCLFHFRQAIYRKVQKFGLTADYGQSGQIRKRIQQIMALAMLPVGDIGPTYEVIKAKSPTDERLDKFFRSVERTFLASGARFPTSTWSQHGRLGPRSNNHVEGFHSTLKKRLGPHSNIWRFLEGLKNYHQSINWEIGQLEGGRDTRIRN